LLLFDDDDDCNSRRHFDFNSLIWFSTLKLNGWLKNNRGPIYLSTIPDLANRFETILSIIFSSDNAAIW
jgi:hypothetical protein